MTNIAGEKIITGNINSGQPINTYNLASGPYHIHLTYDGANTVKRFIKM